MGLSNKKKELYKDLSPDKVWKFEQSNWKLELYNFFKFNIVAKILFCGSINIIAQVYKVSISLNLSIWMQTIFNLGQMLPLSETLFSFLVIEFSIYISA